VENINQHPVKGRLRIYLGYATGCGKTFTLLQDALALKDRGNKVAIAAIGSPKRSGIGEILTQFPQLKFEENLNLAEIVASPYDTIIIDELALTNPNGSKNAKRYEDVFEILDSGKNVFTTLNVQHLDSIAERLDTALRLEIHERVPDLVLNRADAVVFCDLSIDELQTRIQSQQIFTGEKAERALFHFFTYENLCLLRKFALEVTVADQLRRIQTEKMLHSHARSEADPGVLTVITEDEKLVDVFTKMIHKGAKLASSHSAHFYVILAQPARLLGGRNKGERSEFAKRMKDLSESLSGIYLELQGPGLPSQLVNHCHVYGIRHLVFAKEQSARFIEKAIHQTRGIDVHLIDRATPRGEH
jgi:two-component system sensor histidine kinase KdpD